MFFKGREGELSNENLDQQNKIRMILAPRFKVIRSWLHSVEVVGNILRPVSQITIDEYRKFPHLLKELGWWEDRLPQDLPMFVQHQNGSCHKVLEHDVDNQFCKFVQPDVVQICPYHFLKPIPEFTYNAFLKQKK